MNPNPFKYTNDTATHNYFPSWFDEKTILYTQSPENIIMMNVNDKKKKKIEGIHAEQVKYNIARRNFVYVTTETDNYVVLYDLKNKKQTTILDGTKMIDKF